MVLETLMNMCMTDIIGKYLLQKFWKKAKDSVFWIWKICSLWMMINLYYLLCYCTNPNRPKCSQPTRLQDFNQLFRKSKSMKQPYFLHFDKNAQKLKVVRKVFCWTWSKYGCGQSGLWTLNWLCISRMNRCSYLILVVHGGTNSRKLKCNWKFFGWAW